MIQSYFESKSHERYSKEKLLKLQEKRFRKILKYAYNNSKFYKYLYNSKDISEKDLDTISIEKIPQTNKEMLMNNLDSVLTVKDLTKKELKTFINENKTPSDLFKKKYHVIHTSGTSGNQGIFVYSKKEWDSIYPYILKTFNFKFRKKKTAYVGCLGGHFVALSFVSWLNKGFGKLFCNLKIIDINKPIEQIINELNSFQPNILGGFFNQLKILAKHQANGELSISPDVVVNCSEPVIPKDKEYIEEAFKAPLNDLYGFAECFIAGVGKSKDPGIFLFDDKVLIEIKEDHILATNLFNKTMPIIRYRIDDFLTLSTVQSKRCPYTLIDNVIGRVESMIWFKNSEGKLDSLHPFLFVVFNVDGLYKYRVVVKNENSFEFLAVISSKDKNKVVQLIHKELDKILRTKNFTNVTYKIKVVEDIPVDQKSGKYKLVVYE
jgi:phenylacetate-CoA ligase